MVRNIISSIQNHIIYRFVKDNLSIINGASHLVTKGKRVIFIGSCSYSGSTILDMILGRVEDSVSMGEVGRIFLPRKKEHFARECGCMQDMCNYWHPVLSGGAKGLHKRAFDEFGVSTLVDSTKDPHWIMDRGSELMESGVEVINLLIWKTPGAIRKSFAKRGREKDWIRSWKNYHRLYFTLVDEFYSFPFQSLLAGDQEFVERLRKIGIANHNPEYWNFPGHTLFGNDSAKRHLHDERSVEFKKLQQRRNETIGELDTIYSHRKIIDETNFVSVEGDVTVSEIHNFLMDNDVLSNELGISSQAPRELCLSNYSTLIRRYFEISKSFKPYFLWKISNS